MCPLACHAPGNIESRCADRETSELIGIPARATSRLRKRGSAFRSTWSLMGSR
ncbi:Hypothetical protein A7982_00817 [Minicystis rosea]|nr:Hypothetical protein A7982_00817 [Minicystis rosea]